MIEVIHRRAARGFAVLAAACTFAAVAQAPEDVRVALVIGNAAYGAAPLVNPVNDAVAMGATLRTLGFSVTELRDASRAQMQDAVAKVREAMRGKRAIGMLYYAGHGLQVDFRNYMVPVDAKLAGMADVAVQTVDVSQVIEAFKGAGTRMNILVLDACRDNPFAQGSGKGLAPLDAPSGTLLAYATAPGNVAEDGDPRMGNGVYTGFLVKELQKPAAKIEDVFKRVRLQVRQYSKGRQIPWESTSLEEDFYFNDGVKHTFRAEDLQKVGDAARLGQKELEAATAQAREQERLKQLSAQKAAEEAFRAEKADWERIQDSRNPDDYYAFLKKYPSGSISELAMAMLERLAEAKTNRVADKDGIVQVPAKDRYRLGDSATFIRRDDFSKRVIQQGTSRVTEVTEDTVTIGDSLFTREGGTIRNQFVAKWDPPRQELPAGDYVVGKKWTFRTIQTNLNGTRGWVEGEVRIVALEDVTVPAGTFKAYRLELRSLSEWGERVKITRWMQPEWGFAVKALREIRPARGAPTLETFEMLARERGKG